jgi:hypothetical protein
MLEIRISLTGVCNLIFLKLSTHNGVILSIPVLDKSVVVFELITINHT